MNPTELRGLLQGLFNDPTALRVWASDLEGITQPGLNGLVGAVAWGGGMQQIAFDLVEQLRARGALDHEPTRGKMRGLLLNLAPLKQAQIDAVFGIDTGVVADPTPGPGPAAPTHFLDDVPFDLSRPEARDLRDLLARNFRSLDDTERVLEEAGLDLLDVDLGGAPRRRWAEALKTAADHGQTRAVVVKAKEHKPALKPRLEELEAADTHVLSGDALVTGPDPEWKQPGTEGLEKLLAKDDTLLGVAFLEEGLRLASSVVLLKAHFGMSTQTGTAFRVGPRHLLTNHHVACGELDGAAPDTVTLQIGFQETVAGGIDNGDVRPNLAVTLLASAREPDPPRDWALLELAEDLPAAMATVPLTGAPAPRPNERAYIIQHPQGLAKKVGLNRNLIRHVDDDVVQYLTDTQAGSSGSPVFNAKWQLIALHYRYIESDEETQFGYRNQGMRIEPIVQALAAKNIDLAGG